MSSDVTELTALIASIEVATSPVGNAVTLLDGPARRLAEALAEREARIRAEAWDEGFIARLGDTPRYKSRAEWGNPYRATDGGAR